tara:strand:- start:904 stop:2028 length:1125 start_codon:yes stop_codon:yes gene_type:complete
MKKVAMIMDQDLLSFNEDYRVIRESRALLKAKYDVTVFCWARGLDKYETRWEEEKNGIKVVRIFQEESEGFFSKGKAAKKAMSQIVKKIERYAPDIIHSHNLETLEAAAEAVQFNNAKLIFDIHEDIPAMKGENGWFLGKNYAKMQSSLLKKVDAVITPSDELASEIENSIVLFNSESKQNIDKLVENHRFGLNGIVAGYIGTLEKEKLEKILTAGSAINAVSLLIVGGPFETQKGYSEIIEELEEMATEKGANAKFTGPLPYSMMGECYAACDIMMVGPYCPEPLRDDIVPEELLNSMGHKIPVVVEPYKARKRIVERYECGIVSDDWSNALIKLADDKKMRTTLGLNGYKAYNMNYAWELQEEKLLNLYKNL